MVVSIMSGYPIGFMNVPGKRTWSCPCAMVRWSKFSLINRPGQPGDLTGQTAQNSHLFRPYCGPSTYYEITFTCNLLILWCRQEDSNLWPIHYECTALPPELCRLQRAASIFKSARCDNSSVLWYLPTDSSSIDDNSSPRIALSVKRSFLENKP